MKELNKNINNKDNASLKIKDILELYSIILKKLTKLKNEVYYQHW